MYFGAEHRATQHELPMDRSFSNAEAAENAIEDIVGMDGAGYFSQLGQRDTQFDRYQLFAAAGLIHPRGAQQGFAGCSQAFSASLTGQAGGHVAPLDAHHGCVDRTSKPVEAHAGQRAGFNPIARQHEAAWAVAFGDYDKLIGRMGPRTSSPCDSQGRGARAAERNGH
jgi:hypothetical protein